MDQLRSLNGSSSEREAAPATQDHPSYSNSDSSEPVVKRPAEQQVEAIAKNPFQVPTDSDYSVPMDSSKSVNLAPLQPSSNDGYSKFTESDQQQASKFEASQEQTAQISAI